MSAASPEPGQLNRTLGLWETALSGVGMILGAGIYALVGAVADDAGSGIWLSFVIAAIVAAIMGLCYAELVSMFPVAAADFEYAHQAFGPRPALVVGWTMAFGNIIASASVAVAFAGYLDHFLNVDRLLVALMLLTVAALFAAIGIKQSVRLVVAGTVIEASGLVLIIAIGIPSMPDVELLGPEMRVSGVLAGASLVMFAFNGFAQIASLSEEAVDAQRVIPHAMLLAVGLTAVLYILVALSALAVLGAEALAASDAPLATVAEKVVGSRAGDVIAVIALFSTANTALLHLLVASRLTYGMAAESALPRALARVHPRSRTPVLAVGVSLVVAMMFAATGELAFVAGATSFAIFVGFASVCGSLLELRRSRPEVARPFRVPGELAGVPVLPVLGLMITALLTLSLERDVLLVGGFLLAAGLLGALSSRWWWDEVKGAGKARGDDG